MLLVLELLDAAAELDDDEACAEVEGTSEVEVLVT